MKPTQKSRMKILWDGKPSISATIFHLNYRNSFYIVNIINSIIEYTNQCTRQLRIDDLLLRDIKSSYVETRRNAKTTNSRVSKFAFWLFRVFKIQSIDQNWGSEKKTFLICCGIFWEVDLVVINLIVTFSECLLWYFSHPSTTNWFKEFMEKKIVMRAYS